ncbi:DUF1801 domain-containing protein [Bythopirellula polymerisocia]|uniref:YdhG-like domain-containing protein n=1 Tax=Bythopirellula polymerisocia TaxID=2528003 RepID=A0A5C6D505_9BACT|nr:DUF1801 domain-containing protein [Bythopirellula polymerisocia]TWU29959.1 hypothetical protein Pla144_07400 [Bythopirellula polymerisocia]
MSELKTKQNNASVPRFVKAIADEQQRADCNELIDLMKEVTGEKSKMWGDAIVGFGTYHYKYASGREGDWFLVGFSPRKHSLSIYMMSGFEPVASILKKLGKHKTGKCCLYVNRLDDVDRKILKQLLTKSVEHVRKNQGC